MQATLKIAQAAGQDAGNRNMRDAGRTSWNEDDWNVAAETAAAIMRINQNVEDARNISNAGRRARRVAYPLTPI